jgi:hypothetical protein
MQEQTPDSFNWPERPSSSDSAPDVKLEQPPGSKAFYVPSSSTPTFASRPTAVSPPSIRRHSSTGSQLRRSKHPYSPTPHEARIRNKYGGEAVKMSSHNYSQQWVKSENGVSYIPSVQRLDAHVFQSVEAERQQQAYNFAGSGTQVRLFPLTNKGV